MLEPLFLPGTDDEVEQVQEDLAGDGQVDDEVAGTDGEDGGDFEELLPPPVGAANTDDDENSPLPTNTARRLRQEPKISFVFDDTTGDLAEPYLTIFLSRPTVPSSQSPDLRRSTRSDAKKRSNNPKNKGNASEVALSRKRTRDEDESSQVPNKPASKKLKLKETIFVDEDEGR